MFHVYKELRSYVTVAGRDVFQDWYASLRDNRIKRIILSRLDRLKHGNPGDYKYIRDGIFELRIHFGPGYRIYYAEEKSIIIVLLCGGDKSTQSQNIQKATEYWNDYRRNP